VGLFAINLLRSLKDIMTETTVFTKPYTMPADILYPWLKALRSGEYVQGRNALREAQPEGPDGFCCLGVLADLAVKAGVCEWTLDRRGEETQYSIDDNPFYLPQAVAEWAQIRGSHTGGYNTGSIKDNIFVLEADAYVSSLNDSRVPFSKIADYIESNVAPV
jgi:hypothetical protein